MRLSPPPGGKLVRDWIGKRVSIRRDMKNGYLGIPAGARATVSGTSSGLMLKFDPCEHCGRSGYMTRVHSSDVTLLVGGG